MVVGSRIMVNFNYYLSPATNTTTTPIEKVSVRIRIRRRRRTNVVVGGVESRVRVSGLIVVITALRDTRKCRNNVTTPPNRNRVLVLVLRLNGSH